jgi:MFS family permease
MLLALWAGAIADNLDRRAVMLAAQVFMLCVSALLALFAWQGWLTPWLLLMFTFLIACGTTVNGPAWQASVGDIVPRPKLPAAVALNSMGFNIARTAGPAVGGAIVATSGRRRPSCSTPFPMSGSSRCCCAGVSRHRSGCYRAKG